MELKDIMTRELVTLTPDETLTTAAERMVRHDASALPVVDGLQVLGILTDRDIVARGLAKHLDPEVTLVSRCMTEQVETAYETEDARVAADRMESEQIRRLLVLNDDEELVGIVSLGDLATQLEELDNQGSSAGMSPP